MKLTAQHRKTIFHSLIGLLLAAAAWFVLAYLSAATLTVVTSDDAVVAIDENAPTPRPIEVRVVDDRATIRLEAGNYTVTVRRGGAATMRLIDIGIGQRKTLDLRIQPTTATSLALSPVTTLGATGLVASDDHLSFIDSNDANTPLYRVDGSNRLVLLDGQRHYQSVRWADPTFGVGISTTGVSTSSVVTVDDGIVADIGLPFPTARRVSIAVAPNRTWYVADDHTIYRANGDGSFTQIYSTNQHLSLGAASNDALQLTEAPTSAPENATVAALHTDGTKYQITADITESAWSPSGERLVVTGKTAGIFDNALGAVAPLPQGDIASPVWTDDNTLLFVHDTMIWRYDLPSGTARAIATVDPVVGTLSAISVDQHGRYLYASITRAGTPTATKILDRLSLNDAPLPNNTTADRLSVLYPSITDTCRTNFVNFTALTVIVKPTAARANCVDTAKNSIIGSKLLDQSAADDLNFQTQP